MKTDTYTKVILTIIAFSLVVLVFQGGIPKAEAAEKKANNYALVPINPDGSINVHVTSVDDQQEVVIVGWKKRNSNWVENLYTTPFPVKNQ